MTKGPKIPEIIGKAYDKVKEITRKYAENNQNVLFVGERGCGKEEFAKYYKKCSSRKGYRDLNCAAVSDSLIDSEIFGHKKGSFTGAQSQRDGLLKACEKGILFLDEFGDASERFQATILRVAEGNSYRPVGSDEQIEDYDVVIIASTNKIQKVRKDLQDRFKTIFIPSLQTIDTPRLAEHFLGGSLKKKYMEQICVRNYPGNIRELKKFCKDLEIMQGREELLSKKRNYEFYTDAEFEYERYEDEIKLWNQYIQPLLDEFDLSKYRYQYQCVTNPNAPFEEDAGIDLVLKARDSGVLVEKSDINKIIGNYLKKKALYHVFINITRYIDEEMPDPLADYAIENNVSLTYLFKKKKKEAKLAFERTYIRYYLEKFDDNYKKAANAMGTSEEALRIQFSKHRLNDAKKCIKK